MRIEISIGANLHPPQSFVKVDYYKTDESFYNPMENEGEIFNCVTELNTTDLDYSILIGIIEASVNALLKK